MQPKDMKTINMEDPMRQQIIVWSTQQALFLTWQQLRRFVAKRLYEALGRDIHPNPFQDNGYWDILTDKMQPAEIKKLCPYFTETVREKQRFQAYYSKWKREIGSEFIEKLVEKEAPFPIVGSVSNHEGVWFLGKSTPYFINYKDRRNKR